MLRRSKWVIGAALASTLVLLALPSRRGQTTPDEPVVSLPEQAPAEAREEAGHVASEAQLAAQAERSALLVWGRDSFAPPPQPDPVPAFLERMVEVAPAPEEPLEPLPVPRLTGLSRSGAERWAIIDGQIVREGDALRSGHRVASIDRRSVTVLLQSEELTLKLGGRP